MIANLIQQLLLNLLKIMGELPLNTSAGITGVDNDKLSRRVELEKRLQLSSEKSHRRFRIGVEENLFKQPRRLRLVPATTTSQPPEAVAKPESSSTVPVDRVPANRFQTEVLVGVAVLAGLTCGYLIGKSRV